MNLPSALWDLPVSRPGWVLTVMVIVTVLLAAGVPRLRIDASIESMIVERDRDHVAFEAKKGIFGSDEEVAIAIPFADALGAESLSVQRRIAERIEKLPEVSRVDALVTINDIVGRGDELVVESLVPENVDPLQLSKADVARIRERVEANPIWYGYLISQDLRTAAMHVRLYEPGIVEGDRGRLIERVEQILREELDGKRFYLAGHLFMKNEIARTMQRDLAVFLPVTLLIMTLFLIVAIGSVGITMILLAAIVMAVTWMLGLMGWIGEPLTVLSNAAPTILLALGTAYFMHMAASYQKAAKSGMDPRDAVRHALGRIRRPTVVAGITTAIGFGSLATSQVPLIRGFGVDLAVGIMAVVVIAIYWIPAALVVFSPGSGGDWLAGGERLGRFLFGVSRFTSTYPRSILVCAVVSFGVFAMLGARLEIDSSGPNAFSAEAPFRVSSEFYRHHLSGDVIENVYLTAPGEGFKDPGRLRRMLEFQAAAEALPQIDKTISIADYIALMNRAVFDNDPDQERIPESSNAVAQYLLLYSLSGGLDDFDDIVSRTYSDARIVLNATVLSSRESAALREELKRLVDRYLPEEAKTAEVLSTEILLSQAADALAVEQVRSFGWALLLILVVVAIAFRSAQAGALLLLPNCLPIAAVLAVMSVVGMSLSESTSVIAVIALGIAVDSTVHLLAAIRRTEGMHRSLTGAVVHALQTAGRPVFVTGGIVVAGFLVLVLSDFRLISEFGGLTALTMVFCLIADLLVLPAQLIAGHALSFRSKAQRDGARAVLLNIGGRCVTALLVHESGGKASFRLLGEEDSPHPWKGTEVEIDWLLRDGKSLGRLIGVDEVATPIVEIEWLDGAGAPKERGT